MLQLINDALHAPLRASARGVRGPDGHDVQKTPLARPHSTE